MRKIIFRGKGIDGNWVYGDLIHGVGNYNGDMFILPIQTNLSSIPNCDPLNGVRVDEDTIGQFTGLLDSQSVHIFEGDIVKVISLDANTLGKTLNAIVTFADSAFRLSTKGNDALLLDNWLNNDLVVIGNIHDNPNLLEDKQ